MTRDEAEKKLDVTKDGLFLVRESNNFPGDYTLCVRYVVIVGFSCCFVFVYFDEVVTTNRRSGVLVVYKY